MKDQVLTAGAADNGFLFFRFNLWNCSSWKGPTWSRGKFEDEAVAKRNSYALTTTPHSCLLHASLNRGGGGKGIVIEGVKFIPGKTGRCRENRSSFYLCFSPFNCISTGNKLNCSSPSLALPWRVIDTLFILTHKLFHLLFSSLLC